MSRKAQNTKNTFSRLKADVNKVLNSLVSVYIPLPVITEAIDRPTFSPLGVRRLEEDGLPRGARLGDPSQIGKLMK